MPLPKITTAQYELKLPSTGKTVKYRPFLVREEKVLILSLETEDQKQISNAVKQVLKECVLTRGVKIDSLPSFDIEYLFLNIRAKSVGETIELVVTCGDDGVTEVPVSVSIDDIEVIKSEDHSVDVELADGYTVKMKYPSLNQFIETNFNKKDDDAVEKSFEIVASSLTWYIMMKRCFQHLNVLKKN